MDRSRGVPHAGLASGAAVRRLFPASRISVPVALCGLVLAGFFGLAEATAAPDASGEASISVINGDTVKIADWPWQVALACRPGLDPDGQCEDRLPQQQDTPRRRAFCGGSVLAPKLVITAAHCVVPFRPDKGGETMAGKMQVIASRTWLNRRHAGEERTVTRVVLPLSSETGRLLYRVPRGVPIWDVALLVLDKPVTASAIKLAGRGESALWEPGRKTRVTGWGMRNRRNMRMSPRLRMARRVMLPGGVCRTLLRSIGEPPSDYRPRLMNCLGGPAGNASVCHGDSGGSLAAPVQGGGFRLVGVASWGSPRCRADRPAAYTRVAASPIRNWVAVQARRLAGVEVVGAGGEAPPRPAWCRVPRLRGFTPARARRVLVRNRCRLGRVTRDRTIAGRPGRIARLDRFPGWLAPPRYRLNVVLPR